jgi:hypothetical protein
MSEYLERAALETPDERERRLALVRERMRKYRENDPEKAAAARKRLSQNVAKNAACDALTPNGRTVADGQMSLSGLSGSALSRRRLRARPPG